MKGQFSSRVNSTLDTIWLTKYSPYELLNNKRKHKGFNMVRFKQFTKIERMYKKL